MMKVFSRRSKKRPPVAIGDYLQRVDMFSSLARDEIESFGNQFPMLECARGTVFFTPDAPAERLFILKEGQAIVYRLTAGGKKLVTRRLGP